MKIGTRIKTFKTSAKYQIKMSSIIIQEGLEILVINSKVETKINLPTQVNLEIISMVTNLETIMVTLKDSLGITLGS